MNAHRAFALAVAVALAAPAHAQYVSGKPPGVAKTFTATDPAPSPGSFVSPAADGQVAFRALYTNARLQLGTGVASYMVGDGSGLATAGGLVVNGTIQGTVVYAPTSNSQLRLSGQIYNSASAIGIRFENSVALSTYGSKVAAFYSDAGSTEVAAVRSNGAIMSATEAGLASWWFNAAAATGACPATGTGCVGYVLPATQGYTVTAATTYVSVVGGGGAGNTVLTVTDGTNTCTVTFPCSSTNSTGAKRVAAVNGAGTGCVYAASASLTWSITTAGCTTTQPTLKNLDLVGRWQ